MDSGQITTDNHPKKRILIIDDDPDFRYLFKLGLDMAGYETLTAENGADAMSVIERETLDIITVDLMMPVMDGLRFLRWLRNEAKVSLPALVFTSSVSKDIVVEATAAGATDVMLKPVKLPELLEKVARLVNT